MGARDAVPADFRACAHRGRLVGAGFLGCLAIPLAAALALASGADVRLLLGVLPGTSIVVVVAEGHLEPRSVGSYSVRVYGGARPGFPYDDFIAGIVRPRDGAVESVQPADVDGDGAPEIVVVVRAAGTGGYLSADAFHLRGTTLSLVESVRGLAKDADPVAALRDRTAGRPGRTTPEPGEPRR
jgi:hypothetical protein